ncbi:MAG: nucleotidyltransferase domain-containing protein [Firmicutes bacterium]|nr:nucleotidyltransferase domain-containing protein [Bacillota bacterium]
MHRDSVLRVLSAHWKQIAEDYGVRRMAVFGSVARGDATRGSEGARAVPLPEFMVLPES